MAAIPPLLLLWGESNGVESQNRRLFRFAIVYEFHAIRRAAFGRYIRNKSRTDAPPAWLFATPLKTAAGPRQLFAVEEATAGANNAIPKLAAWAVQN
jgi:hypothetical protein